MIKQLASHEVLNQPPPLVDYNLFSRDRVLSAAISREGAAWANERLSDFGALLGSETAMTLGFLANENPPVLRTHDRYGNRIDEVQFHPAWHELLRISIEYKLHNLPWSEPQTGAHVARAALMFLSAQNESGHGCPISMTYSAVPTLQKQQDIGAEWRQLVCRAGYDRRFLPVSKKVGGVLIGMAMTEKQGGSDVRANTTRAVPINAAGAGQPYLVTGHKWFCSAPMSDAFLVLAQSSKGLSCFLLPRFLPDGSPNNFFLQRLKQKLGNRSNASSEVEFQDAYAWLIGEEGRGIANIIDMVTHTRLDCSVSSSGLMRQAVTQAVHHARNRSAFGARLREHALMKNVLADLCLESEAATNLSLRLARAFDSQDYAEMQFRRIATAVAKYWICKRTIGHVSECLECLGGAGYIEESIMPRLFRESPLNSIWEGSSNVICLDILRAIKQSEDTLHALLAEIERGTSSNRLLTSYLKELKNDLAAKLLDEINARVLAERLALALQSSLMVQHAPNMVADAFISSRLQNEHGYIYGTLSLPETELDGIIDRAWPVA